MNYSIRMFTKVLLSAAALPLLSTAATTPVAVSNPGFEGTYLFVSENNGNIYGYIPPNWTESSAWADVSEHYTQESSCHSGSACQRVDVSAVRSGNTAISQSFAVGAGRIYTATVWLKGTTGSTAFLRIQRDPFPYLAYAESDEIPLTGAWQQYTVQGYVNENTTASIVIGTTNPGTFWIDDAAVSYTAGTVTPTPQVGPISKSFFGMHVANYLQGSLQDAGFEGPFAATGGSAPNQISGAIAQPWVDNSNWANGVSVSYRQDTILPHSGASSQNVTVQTVPGGAAVQLVQQVQVPSGKSYTLSFWLRGAAGSSINIVLQNANSPYNSYASTTAPLSSNWQKFSATGVVADAGSVLLMVQALNPVNFWVDDAALVDGAGNAVVGTVPWPNYSFGTLRLWDSNTTWALLEPTKGAWNFTALDTWVAAAKAHGNPDIVLTLGQSPAWASSNPNVTTYYGPGSAFPPTNIQDWRNYITAVGTRYKGSIKYYEIWNEPNDPNYYSGSVAQLVQLTSEAAAILKQIDPAITILSPPPTTPGYLESFLAAGGGAYVDVISHHFYDTPPEDTGRLIANVRLILARYNVTKPLWESEGASGDNTTAANTALGYMARKYLTDLAFGIGRFGWYTWGPATTFCVGTETTANIQTLTSTGKAYGYMVSWLTGANLNSAVVDASGNWQIGITLATGNHGLIVWNPNKSVTFRIPSALGAYEVRDLTGAIRKISGSSTTITINPVLLVGR